MRRQKIRKLILIVSLLLFPVTLYYFSPALIFGAAFSRIINGSFIIFMLMFLLSIPFGRLFCAYLCPVGGTWNAFCAARAWMAVREKFYPAG